MTTKVPHINVCVCTYKRPDMLKRLLDELRVQETDDAFTYSVIIVDNDRQRSAEPVTNDFAASSPISIKYCVELEQNIALARNRALDNADGDLISFIDDDEFPIKRWLLTLFEALNKYGVDGVLGPVKPHFDVTPPQWVVTGKFYDRPSYPTGFVIDWRKGRTGNCLLKKSVIDAEGLKFRPEFRTGEDQDFYRRLIEKGHVFVWVHEAMAYEIVPPIRWNRSFMLRRALLRGATAVKHSTFGARDVVNSIIAVPSYTVALPFAFVMGQSKFMPLLVSLCDHVGKLLALVGINPVRDSYVTE